MPLPVLAKMFVHAAILLVTSRLFFGGFLFVHAAILLVTSRLFSGGFRVGDTFFSVLNFGFAHAAILLVTSRLFYGGFRTGNTFFRSLNLKHFLEKQYFRLLFLEIFSGNTIIPVGFMKIHF